jgi:hypothetical protein
MDARLSRQTDAIVQMATGRSPVFWKAARRLARRIPVRSGATVILLKNNTRSFFPDRMVTLKVANPHEPASANRIRHEISFRRQISPAGGFYVPQILAEGESVGSMYLAESLIADHRLLGPGDITRNFAQGLVDFHKANRVKAPAVASTGHCTISDLRKRSIQGAEELGIKFPRRLDHWAARLESSPPEDEPWAHVHGDLSKTNILVKDDRFALIDWEFGTSAPAFVDAIRLSTQYRGFAELYIDSWAVSQARQWFVLACLRTSIIHLDRMRGLASNRHSIAARRKAHQKVSKIIALAEAHCAS